MIRLILHKCALFSLLAILATGTLHSAPWRLGADHAEPGVANFLEAMNIPSNSMYICTENDVLNIIALAEKEKINVFELIDCIYRYVAPRTIRITIYGKDLRKTQEKFDLGGERILAILGIDTIRYIEVGAVLEKGQKPMDVFLEGTRETYIEIGTALYEKQFGFGTLSPLVFDDAYGITVKKLFFQAPLTKLELFSPGKGAIHVKNMFRPKRWNLDVVTKD